MKNDLRKNGSGYYDETAFKAIKNTMKNQKRGGSTMNKGEFYARDIVTVDCANGQQDFLLLKCHEDYATALMLREKPYKENSVKVVSKSVMYADAGRVAYVYYDKISGYVKTIKELEFTGIQKMIITAMGLEIACEEAPVPMPIAAAEEAVIPLELLETCKEVKDCHKMLSEMVSMEVNVKELKTKNIRLEAERDVYRELFMMANGTKGENNGSENKSEK